MFSKLIFNFKYIYFTRQQNEVTNAIEDLKHSDKEN